MAEEERSDDVQPEEPAAEDTPAAEPPAEESAPEEPAAEERAAEEPAAEEPAPEEPAAEEPAAEDAAPEEPPPEEPAAEKPAAGKSGSSEEVVPGAGLEPIAIEPERQLSAEERARLEAEAEERARLEALATADRAEEEPVASAPRVQLSGETTIQATGKRKSSIARVVVRAGSGEFSVNGRELDEYFPRAHLRTLARQPLVTSGYEANVDVRVRVQGGGVSGQAGAIRHGVARALTEIDPDLRTELKRRGLLTRDARVKERRKAGLKKARKRPQFSKR